MDARSGGYTRRACRVTTGTDLDQSGRMNLWTMVSAFAVWPVATWHTYQARRRLRASAARLGNGRLTLERVA
jgi:hypothetical protein